MSCTGDFHRKQSYGVPSSFSDDDEGENRGTKGGMQAADVLLVTWYSCSNIFDEQLVTFISLGTHCD